LYFGFSIGFSCQADNFKMPAQQQAVNVGCNKMKTLTIIAFLLTISGCSVNRDKRAEPERPKGIPDGTFWVGGADGGNWYLIDNVK
jgi:hypothetical protein